MKVVALAALAAVAAAAQVKVSEVKLRVEPESLRIRPLETAVVQVKVYGTSGERQGRLPYGEWQLQVKEAEGGRLSKPFRFQGEDREAFVEQQQNAILSILNRGVGQFTVKDSALYTAPEKPGRYTIEAVAGSISAQVVIEVTPEAASARKAEKTSFGREQPGAGDPYRGLAEYWSPFVAQETWFQPKSDFLARFDYDGDWQGDNNWERLEDGSSQAYVYYTVLATGTHWFLIYNFFHPRDYSDNCVAGSCHENDNEGAILTVRKDGSAFGKLEVMETLAHNNIYSYTNEPTIRGGIHDLDGRIDLYEGSHPMIFIEAGGHGVHAAGDPRSLFAVEKMEWTRYTGVTYVYKGSAERPRHGYDKLVGYELLPIYEEWWQKSALGDQWRERTFDDYYSYEPAGGRPRMRNNRVGGAFYGRKQGENKAKPFWGWHDIRTQKAKAVSRGQWGLDPAYAVAQDLRMPGPFSLDYTFNPYLDIAAAPPAVSASPLPVRARAPSVVPATPVTPVDAGTPSPEVREGSCELQARVDGSVVFSIRGDQADWRELNGGPVQEATFRCEAGLPAAVVEVEVDKRQGRGAVRLLETPSAANGFVTRVQVDDSKGGADRYRVRVRWKR